MKRQICSPSSIVPIILAASSLISALGADVDIIDDDFTSPSAPWINGGWNKVLESSTEDVSSPPGIDKVFFSHNPGNGGSVSIQITPDSSKTGAGIISDRSLLTIGLEKVDASLTIKSGMGHVRLLLMNNPVMSFDGQYIYADVFDVGSQLLVTVVARVGNTATNLYSSTIVGGPGNMESGDVLTMTCDPANVSSLTYYDASASTTHTLIDVTNPAPHTKNFSTDFGFGVFLAADSISSASLPTGTFSIERLQGSTTIASQGSSPTYDWNSASDLHPGIRHATITINSPRRMVINALRIDLQHPNIRLAHNSRASNWVQDVNESVPSTTRDLIRSNRAQGVDMVAAINANTYDLPPTPGRPHGLAMDRGAVVSPPENYVSPTRISFLYDKSWAASFKMTKLGFDTANIFTAVTGYGPFGISSFVLQRGYVGGEGLGYPDPRSAIGLSPDKRHLVLLTIDGRSTASEGATLKETGEYLRYFGSFEGMNMDSGGSTTLAYYRPSTNSVELLNTPSDGTDRLTASNLGIYYDAGSPPTVAAPASAGGVSAAGNSVNLSVLGADDGGEDNLTYTWATSGIAPAPVTFNANGTNAAKNATATFTKTGTYNLQVTIRDAIIENPSATSNVTVTVNQLPSFATLIPQNYGILPNGTQQFSAFMFDQFGETMATQPIFNWSVNGGGTINASSGLFTAGSTVGGPYIVTASSGGVSALSNVKISLTPVGVEATGGAVMDVGGYRVHSFTGNGTFSVSFGGDVEVLVVAGGGGGGAGGYNKDADNGGGGGGAGGLIYSIAYTVSAGNIPVTVGAGGLGSAANADATSGGASVFQTLTALGGGHGASSARAQNAGSGGSGGGGSYNNAVIAPGSGTAGQGNNGGTCGGARYAGGGGGGAGSAGSNAGVLYGDGVAGGFGVVHSLTGSPVAYAAGGGSGAGAHWVPTGGAGGSGIGGSGGGAGVSGSAGAANTGSGGGGGGCAVNTGSRTDGGNGGSGIVIVRYPYVNTDANSNSIPDAWEVQYFGGSDNPSGAASFDADGDGITNLKEYIAGTSPVDSASKLQISIVSVTPSGAVLQFPTVSGRLYTVEYSDTLAEGSWSVLASADITGTGEVLEVSDPAMPTKRFYRLRVSLP